MKLTPELKKIEENMKPGVISLDGFLGSDSRNLLDILTEDDAAVRRLNRTHRDIAARMKQLRDAGRKGLGEFVSVSPHYDVRVEDVRGKIPSPFGGPGVFPKTNTVIHNKKLDKTVIFSDLQIHMIEVNGFYEGKGCRYRLEPAELIEVLEIPESEES